MTEDGFEEDSVAYTTEWESDKEDAVSRHPFAQGVFFSSTRSGYPGA